MLAVGLMSGTSLDGVDAVLCEIHGSGVDTKVKQIAFETLPIPGLIKEKIKACCHDQGSVSLVCSLNFELGELFAQAAQSVCQKANVKTEELGFIASHGQTIYHIPKAYEDYHASTLQIGESAIIAQRCGCPCIANFRVKDMAVGGEGAPLVPFSEYILYRKEDQAVALQNIGGIGNVTILPKQASIDDVFAFDTGPGNMIIDEAMLQLYQKNYDANGQIAQSGKLIPLLVEEFKQDPYIHKPFPKTTGREVYGQAYTIDLLKRYEQERKEDLIATLTWFTAYSIAENYRQFVLPQHDLSQVILSGGGAHNLAIRQYLQEELPQIQVTTQEDLGYSSDAKEAVAFVILGNETIHNKFSNVPKATGASQKVVLGNITYPN